MEKVHDWQRDRLALKQEREKLQQQDAHAWQRRDDQQAAPDVVRSHERERGRELFDLENKHKAEAAALQHQQRQKIDDLAAKILDNAEHQDTLAASQAQRHTAATMKPKGYRGQRGAAREVRDDLINQREDAARKYRDGIQSDRYTTTDALNAERASNQAARERQEQARKEEPRPAQAWHETNKEAQEQQSRERTSRAEAEREARIRKAVKSWKTNDHEHDGGREFEP